MLNQADLYLFRIINNLAGKNHFCDWLFYFLAEYLIFVMAVAALALFFYYLRKETGKFWVKLASFFLNIFKLKGVQKLKWEIRIKKKAYLFLLLMVLTVGAAWLFKLLINLVYFRPRPYVFLSVNQLLFKSPLDPSFPSGHAVIAFALAAAIFCRNKIWGIVFLILASLVAFGRIAVGVHYPLDILGGAAAAFLAVFIILKFLKKFIIKK